MVGRSNVWSHESAGGPKFQFRFCVFFSMLMRLFFFFQVLVFRMSILLGDASPFFPGILLFRKPAEAKSKQFFLKRTVVEKNGECTPRIVVCVCVFFERAFFRCSLD